MRKMSLSKPRFSGKTHKPILARITINPLIYIIDLCPNSFTPSALLRDPPLQARCGPADVLRFVGMFQLPILKRVAFLVPISGADPEWQLLLPYLIAMLRLDTLTGSQTPTLLIRTSPERLSHLPAASLPINCRLHLQITKKSTVNRRNCVKEWLGSLEFTEGADVDIIFEDFIGRQALEDFGGEFKLKGKELKMVGAASVVPITVKTIDDVRRNIAKSAREEMHRKLGHAAEGTRDTDRQPGLNLVLFEQYDLSVYGVRNRRVPEICTAVQWAAHGPGGGQFYPKSSGGPADGWLAT
ncbi:hypothetical protein FB451DRAFT_1166741 [Mycena latifolia]|nr:hypothetical protein FB451DRAFT_1166741 [Mycena latifolia]